MRIFDLVEETDAEFSPTDIDEPTAILIYEDKGRFELKFPSPATNNKYVVRSCGWVGLIPVGRDTIIRVHPKLTVGRIFELLEFAYDLPSFDLSEGEIGVQDIDGLFERIALILARRVLDRARRGLYRAYVGTEENLSFIRGRIDFHQMMRQGPLALSKPPCEFEDLTEDVLFNQILFWILHYVTRVGIKREDVRLQVQRARRVLSGAIGLTEIDATECTGRLYTRLNDDYKPMHGICRLLLENIGPDIPSGEHNFLPFALDMASLFEAFVAEWLKRNVPATWDIEAQHHAKLEANAPLKFKIDLVLREKETGRPLAVLDTKYKLGESPNESDIQQVVAYAVRMSVTRAFLIYPSSQSRIVHAKVGGIHVSTVVCDLALTANTAGQHLLAQLTVA